MECSPPGFPVYEDSQARTLEWVSSSFSRGPSNPGIEPMSPALTGRFFATEPPGKPLGFEPVSNQVQAHPLSLSER